MHKTILALTVAACSISVAHADTVHDELGRWIATKPAKEAAAETPAAKPAKAAEKGTLSRLGDALGEMTSKTTDLVITALGAVGVPYRYGGNSLESGLDCSGLVREVVKRTSGQDLPRRAAEQAAATQKIDREELRAGDLVFFNTMRRAYSHVGIYVGDGRFVHAPRAGATVRLENMNISYWQSRFNGARRLSLTSEDARTLANRAEALTPRNTKAEMPASGEGAGQSI